MIAHILYYLSNQSDLIVDPMAGGGVTPDTCLALNRRCWAFDMTDRQEARPEIEPYTWTLPTAQQLTSSTTNPLSWPVISKEKPDLIIFGPPASPEGEADGGHVRHILTKKPPTMTKKAYPDCRRKNALNSLRPSSPS
ncbi:MAG: hypothetical protein U9R02_09235 [Thermodesulfobacteriota bacterium]|nr:hypothetical protein [Thermodesulfobacteriota bacterium]